MRYILGVFAVIVIAIVSIILVTRPRGPEEQANEEPQVLASEQAKEGTSAVLTTQGKLVGETERRAIRVSISQTERRLEILTGYEEAVERAHTFPNTHAAYETFLIGLEKQGFARKQTVATTDERGVCPQGKTYIYELKEFSQQKLRLWSVTCSSAFGTIGGRPGTIRKMFQNQIPDYDKLIKDVDL